MARNLASTPFRNVTIELLHPQGAPRNECAEVLTGQGAARCDPPNVSVWEDTQFETAECKLDLVWLFPAEQQPKARTSNLAFLVVGLSGPGIRMHAKGRPVKLLRTGETQWFDGGSEVEFSREGAQVAQFLKLTFKDSAK